MKKNLKTINLKKITIATINPETAEQIKGGSSLPTEFEERTFQGDCPSLSH
ncbi:hypothetical protein [uncultured Kordia sp.]|uniref:hypothetical protein n=1 Tax=uncultured Kordia sp. TaxID=507699 RepID=UPI0026207B31|nr:hypothetical protein [uncultured Kordia sp.]